MYAACNTSDRCIGVLPHGMGWVVSWTGIWGATGLFFVAFGIIETNGGRDGCVFAEEFLDDGGGFVSAFGFGV